MTYKFYEEAIVKSENRMRAPYIGYFSPTGELINFNYLFPTGGHDSWRNPVADVFISFISYIEKDTKAKYDDEKYPGLKEKVFLGYSPYFRNVRIVEFFETLNNMTSGYEHFRDIKGYDEFTHQLLLFFQKAYKNRMFFDAIGREIYVENHEKQMNIIKRKYKKVIASFEYSDQKDRFITDIYLSSLKSELMSYFKDICVQYIGYDSFERFNADGTEVKLPSKSEAPTLDSRVTPRLITSTYANTNERYFNYLLMDFVVQKMPKYIYNEETGKFELYTGDTTYQTDNEEILEKEIASIRRLVPRDERYKYFM